jgi:hypothetical protein
VGVEPAGGFGVARHLLHQRFGGAAGLGDRQRGVGGGGEGEQGLERATVVRAERHGAAGVPAGERVDARDRGVRGGEELRGGAVQLGGLALAQGGDEVAVGEQVVALERDRDQRVEQLGLGRGVGVGFVVAAFADQGAEQGDQLCTQASLMRKDLSGSWV